jgi:2-iminobutanoate/2-iminopropanoate deaminase
VSDEPTLPWNAKAQPALGGTRASDGLASAKAAKKSWLTLRPLRSIVALSTRWTINTPRNFREEAVLSKTVLSSPDAPKAIGPYSQAVRAGHLLFASGQIPLDPASGAIVDGDVTAQTRRVMENLRAVLKAGGLSLADVVRTTIYLIDLNDFAKVNDAYGSYFEEPYPARATVQVARLPRDARVEIDAIAAYPPPAPPL